MLTRWNPYADWDRSGVSELGRALSSALDLRREVERVFNEVERGWVPPWSQGLGDSRGGPMSRAQVEDTGTAYVVRAELPGMTEKDLDISVTGNSVTLKGERRETAPKGYTAHRNERGAFRFARTFSLPTAVDAEKATAVIEHGLFTLTLPKIAAAQPRQIAVKAS